MKLNKIMAVAVALLLVSSSAFAKKRKKRSSTSSAGTARTVPLGAPGNDRCGVGTMIWGESQAVSSQSSEQSTNVASMNTFSVTFNTSGCTSEGFVKHTREEVIYANANFEELKIELAQGEGEVVSGLSHTIGCQDSAAMGSALKAQYGNLIEGNPNPTQMLTRIKLSIANSNALNNCNLVM